MLKFDNPVKRFDMIKTAHMLGIIIRDESSGGKEVEAKCPFCLDNGYHLYLNVADNVYYCHRCGDNGGILDLVSRIKGMTRKEAFALLSQKTATGYHENARPYAQPSSIMHVDSRCKVYEKFLELLTLSDKHRQELMRRGLSPGKICRNSYKSMPLLQEIRTCICNELFRAHRLNLENVPGFYMTPDGEWDFYAKPGYLIPIRDCQGRIQMLLLRLDFPDEKGKYRFFSSSNKPHGTSAESCPHVVYGRESVKVYLTEGPLKADIASHLTGRTYVAIPGVNATKGLLEIIEMLKPKVIVDNFDNDRLQNPNVKNGIEKIFSMLKGYKIERETWPEKYKGIDDYLAYLASCAGYGYSN